MYKNRFKLYFLYLCVKFRFIKSKLNYSSLASSSHRENKYAQDQKRTGEKGMDECV